MRCLLTLGSGLALLTLVAGSGAAQEPSPSAAPTAAQEPPPSATVDAPPATAAPVPPEDPAAAALRKRISELPSPTSDEERNEYAALSAYYTARGHAPLWRESSGLNAKAPAAVAEIKNAADWGLDPADFTLPDTTAAKTGGGTPEDSASAELGLTLTVLKYARFARGGRIVAPPESLSSQLDRRPQFIKPELVLEGVAGAGDMGAYLRGLHPQHPQFERLRQKYLAARGPAAKKLRTNMEMWRWMPAGMGDLHIEANVPEFMLRVVKSGAVVHTERIVAGETGKQTAIFSRPMRHIVLRPKWRVPESIKVRELWPSLRRGGGYMRAYGLELETKDGRPLDWRAIDWMKADIRDYEVVQPPGRKSVLGVVKFSFPSQHTIYMHDTPDLWMFNRGRRTLSHGCLRLRDPVKVAEIILGAEKGWDRAKIDELIKSGPLNNEIALDRTTRMHLMYFTAWVDDAGTLKSFPDVYGHERRVTQALDGKWTEIAKGPDHLAPVKPDFSRPVRAARRVPKEQSAGDILNSALGGIF